MKKLLLLLCLCSLGLHTQAQKAQPPTSLKGQVIDKDTKATLPGATVLLLGSNPPTGTFTNMQGRFLHEKVPVSRQVILAIFRAIPEQVWH